MLELINISKKFKDFYAVKSLNMLIEKGEIVGLLGPNGAGKSTAISILSSLILPTSGDIYFMKESMLKQPQPLRKIIGMVPQEIALYMDLSAEENLRFFGKIYGLKGISLKKKIDEVLEQIGLTDRRKDIVKTFSGGMKRRLNIGVALLHDPQLLIMDEPTVGIDPQSRNYILETVKRLNQEKKMTVLYTSHYMEEVEYLCDRIYIMDQGNLIVSGTKDEIKRIISAEQTVQIEVDLLKEDFTQLLQDEPVINKVTMKENTILIRLSKEVNILQLLVKYAEDTETELISIEVKKPTLEDVFLHLTGRALRD